MLEVAEVANNSDELEEKDGLTPEELAEIASLDDPTESTEPVQKIDRPDSDQKETAYWLKIQRQTLGLLCLDSELMAQFHRVILPEHFDDSARRAAYKTAHEYFKKYEDCPSREVLLAELERQNIKHVGVIAEIEASLDSYVDGIRSREWHRDQLVKFVKRQTLLATSFRAVKLGQRGNDDDGLAELQKGLDFCNEAVSGSDPYELTYEWEDSGPGLKWILPGLLAEKSLTLMYAPKKLGKTTLAQEIVATLATDRLFLGTIPLESKPKAIVYFVSDSERSTTFEEDLKIALGVPNRDAACPIAIPKTSPETITPEFIRGLHKARFADADGPVVMVIDSIFSFFGGLFPKDSNWSNNETCVNQALNPFSRVAKDLNISFLLIHHSSASGRSAGSEQFGARVDYIARLEADSSLGENSRVIELSGRFGRDDSQPRRIGYRLEDGRLTHQFPAGGSAKPKPKPKKSKKEAEQSDGLPTELAWFPRFDEAGQSLREIAERADVSHQTVKRKVDQLGSRIIRDDSGYRLSATATALLPLLPGESSCQGTETTTEEQ